MQEAPNNHYSNGVAHRPEPEEDAVEVKEILNNLLRNWYWIVLCLALGIIGAKLYLRYAVPIYQAKATILIKDNSTTTGEYSEEALLQELGIYKPSINITNEIQILKSRTLMEEVVEELGLDISYFRLGRIQEIEQYPSRPINVDSVGFVGDIRNYRIELLARVDSFSVITDNGFFHLAYGQPYITGRSDSIWISKARSETWQGEQRFEVVIRHPRQAASSYLNKLSIRPAEDFSSVLALEQKDPVPQKAADILNTLVRVYNRAAIADKSQVASQTMSFIDRRLGLLTGELSEVEGNVESYKTANEIPTEATGLVSFAVGQRAGFEQDFTRQSIELDLVEHLEGMLIAESDDLQLIPPNLIMEGGQAINGQINTYNELMLQRERILRSAGRENAQLAALNQQISNMKLIILDGVRLLRTNLEKALATTQEKLDMLDQRIEAVPRQERELMEIKRQQNIKENLYLYLLQKKEETALSSAVISPNARVIDAALPSSQPLQPKPLQAYALSIMLATFLPVSVIFLRTLFNDKVYTEEDVRKLTNIPFLGSVVKNKSKDKIVVRKGSRSMIDEMIRLLRTNINFLSNGTPNQKRTVLITSGTSGDGKSFLTVNLGISLSLADNKVLLMGLDLRKPKLVDYLTEGSDTGLKGVTNYLVGEIDPSEIVYPVDGTPNLFFIPSGPIPPNPTEILGSEQMKKLMAELQKEFDIILIDTAPIGLVADGLVLQKFADLTLFTVRAGLTTESALKDLNQMHREKKLSNPAIVLNGVKRNKRFGYRGKYGYHYGYYEEEKKKWSTKPS